MIKPFSFQVEVPVARLDQFLQLQTKDSRTFIQEQIDEGHVLINGTVARKPSQKVHAGDTISGTLVTDTPSDLTPVDHPLSILFEDDHLLVLNKEQGTVVHPAVGHRGDTLVHYLLYYLQHHAPFKEFPPERPGIVHRLDRGTSGVILVAKDRKTQDSLQVLFKSRTIKKEYEAIVWGIPKPEGRFESVIGRDRKERKKMSSKTDAGRDALTHYTRLTSFKHFSHMGLAPKTGRTHQLRVHLSEAGFPIVGDDLYGTKSSAKRGHTLAPAIIEAVQKLPMTLLHAKSLEFTHPITQELLRLEAPRPEIFDGFLKLLQNFDL